MYVQGRRSGIKSGGTGDRFTYILFEIAICWQHIFEEGPWPAPITEHLEDRLWTQHCLPDAEVTGVPKAINSKQVRVKRRVGQRANNPFP